MKWLFGFVWAKEIASRSGGETRKCIEGDESLVFGSLIRIFIPPHVEALLPPRSSQWVILSAARLTDARHN